MLDLMEYAQSSSLFFALRLHKLSHLHKYTAPQWIASIGHIASYCLLHEPNAAAVITHLSPPPTPPPPTTEKNGRHFAGDIFKYIFVNEIFGIWINISLKFVPKGQINNVPIIG